MAIARSDATESYSEIEAVLAELVTEAASEQHQHGAQQTLSQACAARTDRGPSRRKGKRPGRVVTLGDSDAGSGGLGGARTAGQQVRHGAGTWDPVPGA